MNKTMNKAMSAGKNNPGSSVWIYGINCIESLLETNAADIEQIRFARADNERRIHALCERARANGIPCAEATVRELDQMTDGASHQNVAAFYRLPNYLEERDLDALCAESAPVFLILDCITDTGNFGACLRSAEICGVTAVIIPADRSVGLTAAVVKASAGAVGRVRIVRVANLVRAIKRIQENGVWVSAASSDAATKLYDVDYRRPTAFVLGSEGKGIRHLVRETCDHSVSIPEYGSIKSFNVSAAAAILLYELRRQREG